MTSPATVLCPVDFSDASRGALHFAATIAAHFGARLSVLAVEDPLLTEAVGLGTGTVWEPETTRKELEHFVDRALHARPARSLDLHYEVAVGKPAQEILHAAQRLPCDLIVMSTHGLTGMRKLFFGSTTERVLRETTVPVLVTPPSEEGPNSVDDVRRMIGRILVPVDLTSASLYQLQIARGLSEALSVPMIATHVVEPVRSPLAAKLHLPSIEMERRTRAEDALNELLATLPPTVHAEALVAFGDPAEEISKVARDRKAGLLVVGLHGSPVTGPRMGSVTYRVLCLTHGVVLALPPTGMLLRGEAPSATHSFVHK
jgi:nucleotide-binding universal stress UspA family protein